MDEFFEVDRYLENLKTRRLGRPCIYLDKIDSTIEAAHQQPPGTLVIAKEQLKGRGQRNNVWESPKGCAMGSIRLACSRGSFLASRLCFLQHIMVLVAAKTLEQIDNSKLGKKNIKLKWPNDIIYNDPANDTRLKLGGVLVHTNQENDQYEITLSFGLNIFNSKPTTCVNDILKSSKPIRMDTIVAAMINHLEDNTYYLDESKFSQLKLEYTERCLQMNEVVEDENNGSVRVREVSDDGYLLGERSIDRKLCIITKIIQKCN